MSEQEAIPKKGILRLWRALGPGITTGAADDDPSGVATYSIAGAQFGTHLLWMSWLTWPLMGTVQMMCARIGMVTDMGLAGVFRKKFPRWLVGIASLALLIANVINIGSDLAGMADAANMLGLGSTHLYVVVFGVGIAFAAIRLRYHQIAVVLKWLALVLFAYVATAFIIRPDWSSVLHAAVIPQWPRNHDAWAMVVAILGTTISPYLFYWQAGQEVEEQNAKGRRLMRHHHAVPDEDIAFRRADVALGTLFSNVVMFFIILVAALTLGAHGVTDITTTRQAAEALRPLAGDAAYLLYTVGIIGTGLLAIPTLAGSAAYAFAETFDWTYGLDRKFPQATSFYAVFALAILAGIMMDFLKIDPFKALFWTAVINGLLAPFLLVGVLLVASDRTLMKGQPSSLVSRVCVGITTILMFAAAIGLFVF
ncbi:NRAMP family divalent metal transporter [Solilutibacter silvestris]|uniref:Mn2+ and Fe2+ transporter of the NRAMP family n=1 Tax=Solilutibacter silvestris TaxID=1645665 RepID=A0A2K1Q312_9GAMM|nr:divalent metal cation transporter [Lysobacter silvestris]PNS09428.1 Mn2+ and Fe2+ transporter of the NRAMP family [Lysobacter silvestris]